MGYQICIFYINPMNLYHGSNIVIETPNLKFSRKELDFIKAEFIK